MILDARYEKVSLAGQLLDCAVLIALGITPAGKRTILGVSVALNEAETHWRTFLLGLQQRDLTGVQLLVSDHHAGLGAARGRLPVRPLAALPVSPPAKHPSLLPRLDERAAVANPIRSVFDSPNPRQ